MTIMDLRVATLNISGGEKTFEEFPHETRKSRREALEMLIERLDIDVLCLQEVSQYIDADGVTHSLMDNINKAGGYNYSFYGKTLSSETHMQVKKDVMVKGIFNDWWNWSKGNAIHSRTPFARLSSPARPGVPRNIPLFQPVAYEGNRDTDPRFALISRLKETPFPFVATLHMATLVGERGPHALKHKIEQAHMQRYQQIRRFLDLVRVHILEPKEPLILAGDFNAVEDEFSIQYLLNSDFDFVRLEPDNDVSTHTALEKPVDHIFFSPRERLVDYHCWIDSSELSRKASDHLPVVADIQIN